MNKSLIKELNDQKKRNFKQNIDFMRIYTEWLIKTPNKKWSKEQAEFIDGQYKK